MCQMYVCHPIFFESHAPTLLELSFSVSHVCHVSRYILYYVVTKNIILHVDKIPSVRLVHVCNYKGTLDRFAREVNILN